MAIRVLIVDGAQASRDALFRAIAGAPGFEVVGTAKNGDEALSLVERLRPSIVTIEARLGSEDGVELARRIVHKRPVPIVLVEESTAKVGGRSDLGSRAAGGFVLDVVPKLPPRVHPDHGRELGRLLRVLSALAAVPMVTRHARPVTRVDGRATNEPRKPAKLVLLGASTGGPAALRRVLCALPRPFAAPIVLVQHMPEGFVDVFADWLADVTGRTVRVCREKSVLDPDTVHVAPGGAHVRLTSETTLAVSNDPPRHFQRPSVDVLFESAAERAGSKSVGVLLTGMGADGAAGLSKLKEAGGFTIVQSAASCVVDSMPKSALALGAACVELDLEDIALSVASLVSTGVRAGRSP